MAEDFPARLDALRSAYALSLMHDPSLLPYSPVIRQVLVSKATSSGSLTARDSDGSPPPLVSDSSTDSDDGSRTTRGAHNARRP